MLNIMIVEDDVMFRYALKTVINWEQYGFVIIQEAINGKDAISQLENKRPDVVITDISMPEIDGIKLIKYIKKHYPDIKIIVLSSYDDYKFVRDALLLGAEDYILKFELEQDKLVTLLSGIKDTMQIEDYNKRLHQENVFIKEMIQGHYEENLNARLKEVKEDFCPSVVMIINYDKSSSNQAYENSLQFNEIISKVTKDFILGFLEDQCCVLLDLRRVKSEYKVHELLQKLSYHLIKELQEVGIENCQIGISDIFYDIEKLSSHYKKAVIALQYSFYEKSKKVFFYSNNLIANKNGKLNTLLKELKEATLQGDLNNVEASINEIFLFICQYKLIQNDLKKVLLDLYLLHHSIMSELHKESKSEIKISKLLINEDIDDVEELRKEYQNTYRQLCRIINNHRTYSLGVQKTLEFIHENYKLSNLTVDKIAQSLDITPNYLSNIFKKETGIKITDFMNNLRINEAKRLLRTTNKKVYEIADDVGFNNVTYFCTFFKRKSGVTVKEYRNEI